MLLCLFFKCVLDVFRVGFEFKTEVGVSIAWLELVVLSSVCRGHG